MSFFLQVAGSFVGFVLADLFVHFLEKKEE